MCAHGVSVCVCVQVIRKGEVSCCWICTTCKDNEYVQDEFTCKACELGWWPDEELEGTDADTTEQHSPAAL